MHTCRLCSKKVNPSDLRIKSTKKQDFRHRKTCPKHPANIGAKDSSGMIESVK